MEKYIADKKVIAVTILDSKKTPLENELVKVSYEGGSEEIMPKVRYELISTDSISDASTVMEKVKARVGSILFSTLHEYGIKWGEINGVMDTTVALVDNGFIKATDIKWGCEKEYISLLSINDILKQNHEATTKNDTDGGSSTGDGTN